MAGKSFTRGQTQVLFRYLPEAIFDHDDYGLCKVTRVELVSIDINKDALFDALADALAKWTTPGFTSKFKDPREVTQRGVYEIGAPREVHFIPFPQVYTCRQCERTGRFSDLVRRDAGKSGRCVCGGRLTQLRYVQAHNCGRLEELYVPQLKCDKGHGSEHLAFFDPGRVRQARWYCRECRSDLQALRLTPCKCVYNDSLPPSASVAEKSLKIVPTGDPSLYAPHTIAFINFSQEVEAKLKTASEAPVLMLARAWGLLQDKVSDTLRERADLLDPNGAGELDAVVEALRKLAPDNPLVLQHDRKKAQPRGQMQIDRVRALLEAEKTVAPKVSRRWLFEHTILLDDAQLSTIDDVEQTLRRSGDAAGAHDIAEAKIKAADLLGICDIRVINDFPLALSAYGYTRTTRDPNRAVISSFPVNDRGKIPIFAVASDTEALWFQLDPVRVVAWLIDNGFIAGEVPMDASSAWARLYAQVPGLREAPHEPFYASEEAVVVRTLLHTMSHVFLRRIEWSGFSPSSVGEYLMPATLSFILYANRHAEHKIGGLTTLFEQRLKTWLWEAVQSGRECIYDPLCTDDGGSCAGCTHREHNCVSFNQELSRATIFGGATPQSSSFQGKAIRHGYWRTAWQVTPDA
jgi:hypothetical protein